MHVSPALSLLLKNGITEDIELGYNLGIDWNTNEKTTTGLYTISLAYSPVRHLTAFIESYGFSLKGSTADIRMDYGLSYSLRDNLQIDVSSGIGLSKISPDFFIDTGFSLRLPD